MADNPRPRHQRPAGTSDQTVAALGKLSEALETIEDARGHLYAFHRLTGTADFALGDAVNLLEEAGHVDMAHEVATTLVGRNVLDGRWTFQIVEEYDEGYYAAFRAAEKRVRDELAGGRTHIFESEMKESRRSHGRAHHEASPRDLPSS